MSKTYEVETEYGSIEGVLECGTYPANNSLAVSIRVAQDGTPFARITVCIPEEELSNKNCAFIDTNNCRWAEHFLEANDIAKPTGNYGFSGWCTYPEYEFDMSIFSERKR